MTSGKYYYEIGTVDCNDASTLTIGALKIDPLESRWNTSDEQAEYHGMDMLIEVIMDIKKVLRSTGHHQ